LIFRRKPRKSYRRKSQPRETLQTLRRKELPLNKDTSGLRSNSVRRGITPTDHPERRDKIGEGKNPGLRRGEKRNIKKYQV